MQNLGSYEAVSKSQSISPKGLIHCLPLSKGLIALAPTGEIHGNSLRAALFQLLMVDPACNDSKYNGSVWVGLRIERITCLLNHMRRLKNSQADMRQCASMLTAAECIRLQEVVHAMDSKDPGVGKTPIADEQAIVPYGSLGESDPADTGPKTAKRKLQPSETEVSLDSEGFPACLKEPSSSSGHKKAENAEPSLPAFMKNRPGRRATVSGIPWDCEELRDQMGFAGKAMKKKKKKNKKKKLCKKALAKGPGEAKVLPKAKAKAKAKAEAKAKGLAKAKAKAKAFVFPTVRSKWHKIQVTTAKKPARAYIQGILQEGDKKRLIVEISLVRSPKYKEHIESIRQKMEEHHLTRQEALEERDRLCSFD